MKKILFVINSLTIGGSEKSLVSLLNLIDYSEYEVDLLMLKKGDTFDKYIPKEVNILDVPEYYKFLYNDYEEISLRNKLKYTLCRYKCSIGLRVNKKLKIPINNQQILYKNQKSYLEKLKKQYDVAIAYAQGFPTYYIVDKVSSKKKIAWINCDYATTMYDKEFDYNYYTKIDNMVVVSEAVRKSMIKYFPQYKEKLKLIFDIVNSQLIIKMSNEKNNVFNNKNELTILTVGRLSIHHKGYDIAAYTAKLLKDKKYKFKWYIVGEGPDRNEIEELIKKHNIEDCFILLGAKDNPYPYMNQCDLYVQPSRKEGFGLTVVEAKILNKPIICTNFNTAKEIISDGIDGMISGMDALSLSNSISEFINNKQIRYAILNNIKKSKIYDSTNQIEELYKLLEG